MCQMLQKMHVRKVQCVCRGDKWTDENESQFKQRREHCVFEDSLGLLERRVTSVFFSVLMFFFCDLAVPNRQRRF